MPSIGLACAPLNRKTSVSNTLPSRPLGRTSVNVHNVFWWNLVGKHLVQHSRQRVRSNLLCQLQGWLSNLVGVCSPRIRRPKPGNSATDRRDLSVLAVALVRLPLGAK